MPFEVGQVAADYEILGILGKGGMGRVYRVRNVISNRVEAMKVLLADVAAEADLGDRFIGEIRTLARLDHPNIAKFHTAFKFENQLVMLMELVEGFTLSERGKQEPLPLNEVLSYATQTLAALSYAHQNGVIHRDIKPSNIMVTPHGVVKLMDFGIAKSTFEPLLTRPGTTMGSMLYMSPEQVRGMTVDARSDIYSVGVLLYELTSGRRPFEADNTYAILEAQLNATPQAPIELNPALPKPLNDIIMTALAKEPMQRFQTADAFRNALESIRERPAAVRQPTPSKAVTQPMPLPAAQSGAPPRKRGLWMALGAVACVCVLAGGAYLLPHFWKSSAGGAMAPVAKSEPATQPVASPASQPAVNATPDTAAPAPNTGPVSTPAATSITQPANAPSTVEPSHKAVRQLRAEKSRVGEPVSTSAVTVPVPVQQQQVQPQAQPQAQPAAVTPPGPSQADLDKASEDLMKLHARADAVKDSLDRLRGQNAASGLGLRQDIVASASRMDSYLQAADRALQSNTLDSARKDMNHAEEEINKLEAFFGR
jgi:serine/threonine-protein kinase